MVANTDIAKTRNKNRGLMTEDAVKKKEKVGMFLLSFFHWLLFSVYFKYILH